MKIKFTDLLLNAREFIDSIYNVFQFFVWFRKQFYFLLFSAYFRIYEQISFFFFSSHTELFFVNYSILESFLDPLNY